jgi:hypothetical protein
LIEIELTPQSTDAQQPPGLCLRYPPTLNSAAEPASIFPTTNADDWCGEFQAPPAHGENEPRHKRKGKKS